MMRGFVSIIANIGISTIITNICCISHSRTARRHYSFRIVMSCRKFKNSSAILTNLSFRTGSSLTRFMSDWRYSLNHFFTAMLTMVFLYALALTGGICNNGSIIPFMTCWIGVITYIAVTAILTGIHCKTLLNTSRSNNLFFVVMFCNRR